MESKEVSAENGKQLNESLQKCRCCFRMLIDERKVENLTEDLRIYFQDLTGIKLLVADIFADRICKLCSEDLKIFANLREDLITKQKTLYELAGLEDVEYLAKDPATEMHLEYEEAHIVQDDENSQDFEIGFETVEDGQMFEDEEMDEGEFISEETAEADEDSVIKIEKVERGEDSLVTDFDFFEEIVGDDDGGVNEEIMVETADGNLIKDEVIPCETCGIELSKSHLHAHIQAMHRNFTCTQCDIKFFSKISLKRHAMEAHQSDKVLRSKRRHFCPLCPKHYDYRKQLEDHVRSFHEKERNAVCHICNKNFYHRDLKKHIEHVHGDKNVSCETCGKLYTCVENLRLHMRYHLPPLYTCSFPECGKKFYQKVLWEHHEKKHSTEKSVSCDMCGASFYSMRDMTRHQQRVHAKVTRKCDFCEVSFSRKDKYRQHIIKKHKEMSDDVRDAMLEHIRTMKWNES